MAAIQLANPIASANGVYKLHQSQQDSKRTASAMGAFPTSTAPSHLKLKRASTGRIDTVVISSGVPQTRTRLPVGVATPAQCAPIFKAPIQDELDLLLYDYHLLVNHASPEYILNTIRNPFCTARPNKSSRKGAHKAELQALQRCKTQVGTAPQ